MRVTCPHCLTKAKIRTSRPITETITDLYCQCMNAEHCGGTFVYRLAFCHDIKPPVKNTLQLAASLLMQLSKEERTALLQGVNGLH